MVKSRVVIRDLLHGSIPDSPKYSVYGLFGKCNQEESLIETLPLVLTQSPAFADGFILAALKQVFNELQIPLNSICCVREESDHQSKLYIAWIGDQCHYTIVKKGGEAVDVLRSKTGSCSIGNEVEPEVTEVTLDGSEDCFILAPSTFWKGTSNQAAGEFITQKILEREEVNEKLECMLSQDLTELTGTFDGLEPIVVMLRPDQEKPKTVCSSPSNGSFKVPEISMNDISVIDHFQSVQITSPENRESYQSVCSQGNSSMYDTAYDETKFFHDLNDSNVIERQSFMNGSSALTSTAEIHEVFASPSPTMAVEESTLIEDGETIMSDNTGELKKLPDFYEKQVTPSPILSPSPQGHEMRVTSIEEMEKLEAEAVQSPSIETQQQQLQQLESGFRSESDQDSPSCETRADSFEFNTCTPLTQEQQHNKEEQSSQLQEEIIVVSSDAAVPEEVKQEEKSVCDSTAEQAFEDVVQEEEVVAPQVEQSQEQEEKLSFEDQEPQQLHNMFPPVESASYKTEGLKIEESIEEPKLLTDLESLTVTSTAVTISPEPIAVVVDPPSNPFLDFQSEENILPSSPAVLSEQKKEEKEAEDKRSNSVSVDHAHAEEKSQVSNMMNFNQVIQESMAISPPISSESHDHGNSNGEENGSSLHGYTSSFNENTVIESDPACRNNDSGDHINESSNLPASSGKFQDESEDSDSSQDSVKENTFPSTDKQELMERSEAPSNTEVKDCPSIAVSNEQLVEPVYQTETLAQESSTPLTFEEQSSELSTFKVAGQLGEEEVYGKEQKSEEKVEELSAVTNDQSEVQIKEQVHQVFTDSHENLRGTTESENEVRNCVDDGLNVNGSPLHLVEDNHDDLEQPQTKEGNICGETFQQPQNGEVTKHDPRHDPCVDHGEVTKHDPCVDHGEEESTANDIIADVSSESKGFLDSEKASEGNNSANNISKIEMPSPMRDGLIDLEGMKHSPLDDYNQWGAPSLLLDQQQQDLFMSASSMSQASPLVLESSSSSVMDRPNPVAREEGKPELMIDIMKEHHKAAFSPDKTSTPLGNESSDKPLSPQHPSSQQIPDSVPDLIVESKSVDLKKATVGGRAKVSRGESKSSAPDVQKNTTSKPAPAKAATRGTVVKAAAPQTTKPGVSATAPRPATRNRTTTSRPAVVNVASRTATTTAARKPATAPPKPSVPRTASTAAARLPPTRPLIATTRAPASANNVKSSTASKVTTAPRPTTNGVKATTRPVTSSLATRTVGRQGATNGSSALSKPSSTLARSAASTSTLRPRTSSAMSRNVSTGGLRTANTSTASRTSAVSARKPEVASKPASTTSVAPRPVKKVLKSEASAVTTNGISSNGLTTNGSSMNGVSTNGSSMNGVSTNGNH